MKACKFTKKGEAKLEPRENIGHGLPQTADHDVMQTTHNESIWTMRKYVAFVNRNRELYDELMEEEETSPLDISMKRNGKENTPCISEVLRENKNDVIEFNACDKADDFKGMKRKEKQVDYIHQERSGGESRLWEKGGADLRDPRQVSEVDLKKLIMSNSNLEMQWKEKLIEVLLRYTEFFTTRPGKRKVYEYNFNITDTTPIIGHSRPVPYSARAGVIKQIEQMMEDGILELSDSSFINPLTTVH
jgi:peroxiredoxin family protein